MTSLVHENIYIYSWGFQQLVGTNNQSQRDTALGNAGRLTSTSEWTGCSYWLQSCAYTNFCTPYTPTNSPTLPVQQLLVRLNVWNLLSAIYNFCLHDTWSRRATKEMNMTRVPAWSIALKTHKTRPYSKDLGKKEFYCCDTCKTLA